MGRMAQRLARRADEIYLVVAGYAVDLRKIGEPFEGGAGNAKA